MAIYIYTNQPGLHTMNIIRPLHLLLFLGLISCGGGGDTSYVYENQINEKNPTSFSQVAIYHLEPPTDVAPLNDSGGSGWDTIHFSGKSAELRTFCLDLEKGEKHRAQIFADSNSNYVSIDSQTSCATIRTDSGRVKISLIHDGFSLAENIFVYEADASSPATSAKRGSSTPTTIISATGCPSCNLANADLSNRDLHDMDFSGANLQSANLSKSNLTSADLLGANLTDISTSGANFSRTVWSDGTICSQTSNSTCDPFVFTLQANLPWQDTGILVRPNRVVVINAAGVWIYNPYERPCGPDGNNLLIAKPGYPLPGAPEGALIGKIDTSQAFLVGRNATSPAGHTGLLSLSINDDILGIYGAGLKNNRGEMQVQIRISK